MPSLLGGLGLVACFPAVNDESEEPVFACHYESKTTTYCDGDALYGEWSPSCIEVESEEECAAYTRDDFISDVCSTDFSYRNVEVVPGTCDDTVAEDDTAGDGSAGDGSNGGDGDGDGDANPWPPLQVDLSGAMPCVGSGVAGIDDLLIGGDGTPVTCTLEAGRGAGEIPPGMTVDPDTCRIVGDLDAVPFGAWSWIVEATQSGSGETVLVPYCVMQNERDAGAFDVTVSPGGVRPWVWPADGPFDTEMGDLPELEILGTGCTDSPCYFGYEYDSAPAPLVDARLAGRSALLGTAGFTWDLELHSSGLMPGFSQRPWVLSFDLGFCLADDHVSCDKYNVSDNIGGRLHWSMLMVP